MKSIKYILIVSFFASLFSCMNSEIGINLQTADSLYKEINKLDQKYKSINEEEIKLIYDTIKQNLDSLNKYMLTLPENNEAGYSLAIFTDVSKQAKHFVSENYSNEIDFSKKQIENLKTDIENNALPSDSVSFYISSEKDALLELQESVERHSKSSEQIREKYERSRIGVTIFIDSLRNAKNE